MSIPFTHLHVHSEYSLLDGAAKINELVERAKELNMNALALTDHGVMYGVIPFYKACKEARIKPIIGCEMYFTSGSRTSRLPRKDEPIYHLTLIAKTEKGYQNLMKLSSLAHLEGFHYRPRIDFDLLEKYHEGIICLSGCMNGFIPQLLMSGQAEAAKKAAQKFHAIFQSDFYIEIQDHGIVEQKKLTKLLIELARELKLPLAATNDVHYIRQGDHALQDVLIAIGTGKTLADEDRFRIDTDQLYLKSTEEMTRLFRHVPEAIENTARIADSCHVELDFDTPILPQYPDVPKGTSAGEFLRNKCIEGLQSRYAASQEWTNDSFRKKADDRLRYELSTIERMGYSDYFLIVWDFVRYAKRKGIAVGPGRGSSAGSLVAYVLGITDVDPLKYGLLFERFLNPERVSMPDIDIDFSDERRDEVIRYVVNKYGADHVAQIITFGTMAARAAVRDVGRVMNVPYAKVDQVAKMIPGQPGMTLKKAMLQNPDLLSLIKQDAQLKELIQTALKIEGMPRHASTHAAGVVISKDVLTDSTPLQEGTETSPLTQYSMEHLESIGMLKMDFLGLRTLSIVERTVRWVKEQFGKTIDFQQISDADPETYAMLSRGETTGVFQLESPGMRRVLKELKPSQFEDIISVGALYRPGPMEFIPQFIAAKHGHAEVHYPHPSLEPILKDTYGIIVYQEQIMQIAAKMAGFSLGEADLLRRAVSKKKRDILDQERAHFVSGSVNMGYTEEEANVVYDMIVRFADYGFPRAHATAYGVLAYQTAYLKAHYPVQFMASTLTAVMSTPKKVAEYADACRRMNIPLLAPDVNESGYWFTPVPEMSPFPAGKAAPHGTGDPRQGKIRFGLAAVKNVGTNAIRSIIQERNKRPFENLLDFCQRVDLKACNKRVIESLILSGAMDSLPGHRAQKLAMLDESLEAAMKWKKERDDLQLHLFGFEEELNWTVEYPEVRPFSEEEQLDAERELIGMYVSGHPLDRFDDQLSEAGITRLHELTEFPNGKQVLSAGMVRSFRRIVSRSGQPMAFVQLEDRIGEAEAVFFPTAWKKYGAWIEKGRLLMVRAKLQHDDEETVKLLVDQAIKLDDQTIAAVMPKRSPQAAGIGQSQASGGAVQPIAAKAADQPAAAQKARQGSAPEAPKTVFIRITEHREKPELLHQLKQLLTEHPGSLNVILYYDSDGRKLALNDKYNVLYSEALFRRIEGLFGPDTVRTR